MKNLILTGLAVVATISLSFGQLKVVAPEGNVNLGDVSALTAAEIEDARNKLNVGANVNVMGNLMKVGYKVAGQASKVQIGIGRTAGGNAIIECYGLPNGAAPTSKLLSNQNGVSTFTHNGNGQFQLKTTSANADIFLMTQNTTRMIVLENGNVGVNELAPSYQFQVNGAAAKPGGGSWTNASDKRLKENIKQYDMGLEDVLKLNPVYYNYNGKGGISDTETTYVGLIAQEYQKVAPDAVSTFTHTEMIPQEEDQVFKTGAKEDYLAIDPSQITFMLVNAIKEQQKVISELQQEVRDLKTTGVSSASNSTSVLIEGSASGKALLAQNRPNPFTSNTNIEYFVPATASKASMSFTDITGKEIKRLEIANTGAGSLDVSIKELPIGIYSYSLVVDGKTTATKKMVLSR